VQPTAQAALGVQAVFSYDKIPVLGDKLQLVLPLGQAAFTDTAGLVTFDRSVGAGIQVQF
jgi:hypothetical protein